MTTMPNLQILESIQRGAEILKDHLPAHETDQELKEIDEQIWDIVNAYDSQTDR